MYLYGRIRLGSSQSGGNHSNLQLVPGSSTAFISALGQRERVDVHANSGVVVVHTLKMKTGAGPVVMCWCVSRCVAAPP